MKDIEKIREVQRRLDARGIDSSIEYPGYLDLPLPCGQSLCVGLECGEWRANISEHEGAGSNLLPVESVALDGLNQLPLSEAMRFEYVARKIQAALVQLIAQVRQAQESAQ